MDFLTREVFDTLIVVVIIIGLALAAVRLYADLSRPLPPEPDWSADDDTQPHELPLDSPEADDKSDDDDAHETTNNNDKQSQDDFADEQPDEE
ncbi:MAG: hypothetical protein D6737_18335 [Chloroflexi bacterium]|nr:MAG: hypothetical protein D6737_18335 [Chloroflexota bacterium]